MSRMLNTLATLVVVASSASAFVASPTSVQLRSLAAASSALSTPAPAAAAAAATDRSSSNRRARAAAGLGQLRATAEAATTKYELDEKELRGPLIPIDDTIMVKVDVPRQVTEGGVFLPKMKNEKITRGTVTAVGEGKRHWDTGVHMPITVEVGDRVVYGNYDGTSVEYQGLQHLLMRDTELLMAYEGEEINLDTARMIGDRVLLKVKAMPKGTSTSSAGVLIAESATRSNRPSIGEVVKVGPGRMVPSGVMMPMYCEVGDCVKYKDFAAEVIKIKGLETEEYELVCIRNVDVLAKW